jgi:hypothetical protein
MFTSFQSYTAWVPPSAMAALQAADCGCSAPSCQHVYVRLAGDEVEPWALAELIVTADSAVTTAATTPSRTARRRLVVQGLIGSSSQGWFGQRANGRAGVGPWCRPAPSWWSGPSVRRVSSACVVREHGVLAIW